MTGGSTALAVESRLRRLDRDATTAFVADLWEARGIDTERHGDGVITSSRGETIVVPSRGRFGLGTSSQPDRSIDVVVAPGGGRHATSLASRHDARLLDAADLREMLLYAVDRDVASVLAERHLGAPIEDLDPPRLVSVRRRARRLVPTVEPKVYVAITVGVVVLGALAVILALSGGGGAGDPVGRAGVASSETTPDESTRELAQPPPGVSADGISNLSALSRAHAEAVGNRSYVLRMNVSWPIEAGSRPLGFRHALTVTAAGDRYVLRETVQEGGRQTLDRTLYHDGVTGYVRETVHGDERYRRVESGANGTVSSTPAEIRRTVVSRYLSTPQTRVEERVDEDGRTRYLLVGRGRPSALNYTYVRNYTVVALLDSRGVVHGLTAEYDVVTYRRIPVRLELSYRQLDTVVVTPPDWLDRAFQGRKNATGRDASG